MYKIPTLSDISENEARYYDFKGRIRERKNPVNRIDPEKPYEVLTKTGIDSFKTLQEAESFLFDLKEELVNRPDGKGWGWDRR